MLATRLEIGGRLLDFIVSDAKRVHQADNRRRIALLSRNDIGVRSGLRVNSVLADRVVVGEIALAERRSVVRDGEEGIYLVRNNIAKRPVTSLPDRTSTRLNSS